MIANIPLPLFPFVSSTVHSNGFHYTLFIYKENLKKKKKSKNRRTVLTNELFISVFSVWIFSWKLLLVCQDDFEKVPNEEQ